MSRKLFCQLSPATYWLSVERLRMVRRIGDLFSGRRFARGKSPQPLPVEICRHASLIRRKLGDVDMRLQENKAVNLALTAPKISGILIRPGEIFSFWRLAGRCTARKGYLPGLVIKYGGPGSGVGGGMCQMTNLIHWMVLHSPLTITERHHHDGFDLFPDFGRAIPFGSGTSVMYNYLDYRFENTTDKTFRLEVWVDGEYLRGSLQAECPLDIAYHIKEQDAYFTIENGEYYRHNTLCRRFVNKATGELIREEFLQENRARVCYDSRYIDPALLREPV